MQNRYCNKCKVGAATNAKWVLQQVQSKFYNIRKANLIQENTMQNIQQLANFFIYSDVTTSTTFGI